MLIRRICLAIICGCWLFPKYSCDLIVIQQYYCKEKLAAAGRKILPNAGANATKFFTLATKSEKKINFTPCAGHSYGLKGYYVNQWLVHISAMRSLRYETLAEKFEEHSRDYNCSQLHLKQFLLHLSCCRTFANTLYFISPWMQTNAWINY